MYEMCQTYTRKCVYSPTHTYIYSVKCSLTEHNRKTTLEFR
uniref:Uncharacterized protein n=1 Tax=Anguilla anguilla TaxID=7936 RepID=A0A0E9SDQ1_ANGAN